MTDSDYTVRSRDSSRYIGDFKQLFDSSKKLRDCMVDTLQFIGDSSVQVTAGSDNLAETSQSLAEDAYQQSQEYADLADNSSSDIKAMVEAMERINEASKKIGNIISEIESIASQTNLLSSNASIGTGVEGIRKVAVSSRELSAVF